MVGEALVAIWIVTAIVYLVRQQLRGDLSGGSAVPPLPFRGALPDSRGAGSDHTERAA